MDDKTLLIEQAFFGFQVVGYFVTCNHTLVEFKDARDALWRA
jgi:hypothetical protein